MRRAVPLSDLRANAGTLLVFAVLGPTIGLIAFGGLLEGAAGAVGLPFLVVLAAAWLPTVAAALLGMLGVLPALCAATAALAVRRFDRWWLYGLASVVGGTAAEFLATATLGLARSGRVQDWTMLPLAAALAAAGCAALTYRLREEIG